MCNCNCSKSANWISINSPPPCGLICATTHYLAFSVLAKRWSRVEAQRTRKDVVKYQTAPFL